MRIIIAILIIASLAFVLAFAIVFEFFTHIGLPHQSGVILGAVLGVIVGIYALLASASWMASGVHWP